MTTPDPMAEIRASFFIECDELLEALQDGLVQIDSGATDDETVNVCFRAVHSIKGGAGAFGLDELVRFAHRYETVLDEVRSHRLEPTRDAVLLFMRAADILSDIVRNCRDGTTTDPDAVEPTLRELEALTAGVDEEEEITDFQPTGLSLDLGLTDVTAGPAADPVFEITFRPERELFQSGNEPLFLLSALSALGSLETTCDTSALPPLEELDAESAGLAWTLRLTTNRSRSDIEEVFEFVDGLCVLEIVEAAPASESTLPPLPGLADLSGATESADTEAVEGDSTDTVASRLTLTMPDAQDGPDRSDGVAAASGPRVPVLSADPSEPKDGSTATAPRPSAQGTVTRATVRVDLERIERLVNLVGELVINQAMLSQSVAEAGLPANSPVAQGLEEFMQLTRDIQDSVMMIRAQPVKSLFQRMARIVRESSASIGKRVRLVTDGEATEVDKTVIERLADPLTHMIRNAVDHGLEDAETREAAGKPPEGCVQLSAAHRSGRVIIEVSDDGGGIDRKKVRAIAEEKGLVPPGQPLSDSDIDALLFLPGFSTARKVSNLSGRGVGMDVVRKAIQDLGGRVSITSTPGKGTSFSISLPLTLAILDGMVVEAAEETLVVPLGSIVETLMVRNEDMQAVGPDTQVLRIRDSFVPLMDLGVELGFREPLETYSGSVVLLITLEDGTRSAMIVDAIHEQRQVVIKGLQDSYGHIPGIAAATILGDGQVALILDPLDLMTNATGRTRAGEPRLTLAG
ncbi:chemotaxis protein CheA [Tropicimonas sp. IMCC6043]|uniref:chemotaxis protein CheA n=1 Tax=Tropicimonas sp. IMCC6043 TaxID=2510645 RepID=UPI00101DF68C|nr:chemotaxis protein CheA [Tropicimonas sp. IMCC6043]RYH09737.1 chemotaxis protein CheA [Tropicimonas sp. IMCC6043]